MDINDFREKLDADEGLISKPRILVSLSVIFIALNISGASLQEANTLIFKIKFTRHKNLIYLFFISISFMLLRYYAYAKSYHDLLFSFWSKRMISDYKIFQYTPKEEAISGLLSKRIDVWPGDEPGIQDLKYEVARIFKRNLVYQCSGHDEIHGDYYYDSNIELNKYSETWQRKDFLILLKFEARYQLEAILKYRESLDILFPYVLGFVALFSFFIRDI
ncbi:hypothetical protein [Rheinheimera sp.]|uniref:hypothetical protein n=1 Tax=Rheinheimera sp. TaxID=1869214 RepID=UPI0027BA01C0|nr:hypothetical protein [Rheinheimera sp.]